MPFVQTLLTKAFTLFQALCLLIIGDFDIKANKFAAISFE
jgi:hypothetical protein